MAGNTDEFKVRATFEATVSKFNKAIDSALKKIDRFEAAIKKLKDPKLGADDSVLQKKITKANEALKNIDRQRVNAIFDANDRLLTGKVENFKNTLKKLDNTKADAKLDADTKPLKEKVTQAEKALYFLDHKSVNTLLNVDSKLFLAKIGKAKAEVEKLDNTNVNVDLEVDSAKAEAEISTFKARLRSIPNVVKTKLKIDESATSHFKETLKSLNKKTDEYQQKMDALAKSIRNFGTIAQNVMQGTLLMSWSALIPIIASCIPVIMAVGNALAVVGGGALGVAGAAGIAGAGLLGFGAMAKTATSMLEDGLIQASDATYDYKDSLEELKSTWQGIVKQNADHIFYAMGAAVSSLSSTLDALSPFLSGVASLVDRNALALYSWATSSDTAKKAFQTLNTVGVQIFGDLMNAAGRFGDGFVNILTQFAPLFKWVSQGLQNMSIEFQKWANSVSTAQGIQQFIEYVKTNLPVIGQIFGNVFIGIFNIFKAFGSNSQGLLQNLEDITAKFRDWSEGLANSQGFKTFMQYMQQNAPVVAQLLGSIARVIGRVIIAMAPIGSVVLRVVTAFAGFLDKLTQFSPVFSVIIGAVAMVAGAFMALVPVFTAINTYFGSFSGMITKIGGLFTSLGEGLSGLGAALSGLSAPVLIVIGVIAALVAIFVYLWNTNESFRNAVMNAWNAIVNTIMTVVNAIVSFVMSIWQVLVDWWTENQQLVMQAVQVVWGAIGPYIMGVLNNIIAFMQAGWQILIVVVQTVWEIIKTVIMTAIKVVLQVIKLVMQLITGDWSGAWQTIKSIGSIVWNAIVSIVSSLMRGLVGILRAIWGLIVSVASNLWGLVKETIGRFITGAFHIVSNIAHNIWNAVSNAFNNVVNTVRDAMSNFFNAIKDKLTSAYDAVVNFAKDFYNAGKDLIKGLIDGVKNFAHHLIDAVSDVVGSAIDKAKSLLNINSPSRVFRSIGASTMEGFQLGVEGGAGGAIDAVANAAKQAIDVFKPQFDKTDFGFASGLSNLSATTLANVAHHHTFEDKPNKRVVRIEMGVDNDALTAIVNDKMAEKDSILEF